MTLKDIKEAGPDLKHYVPDKSRDRFPQGAEVIQVKDNPEFMESQSHGILYPGLIYFLKSDGTA